jgi:hypothetical protein
MHNKIILSNRRLLAEDFQAPSRDTLHQQTPFNVYPESFSTYLIGQENLPADISKFKSTLQMGHVILEIGCGNGNVAAEIARKNPVIGVIGTDKYDWSISSHHGSYYQETALNWKERQLEAQNDSPDNLVLLRAGLSILNHMPAGCIDTIFLVNPEPSVGQAFMNAMNNSVIFKKIKHGEKQIVILPFSKEMGVTCCGGNEFGHSEDWSRGLGFMMDSNFDFQKGEPVHWGVNLVRSSPYSRNSTQNDVFAFGHRPQHESSMKTLTKVNSILKGFIRGIKQLFKFRS